MLKCPKTFGATVCLMGLKCVKIKEVKNICINVIVYKNIRKQVQQLNYNVVKRKKKFSVTFLLLFGSLRSCRDTAVLSSGSRLHLDFSSRCIALQ